MQNAASLTIEVAMILAAILMIIGCAKQLSCLILPAMILMVREIREKMKKKYLGHLRRQQAHVEEVHEHVQHVLPALQINFFIIYKP